MKPRTLGLCLALCLAAPAAVLAAEAAGKAAHSAGKGAARTRAAAGANLVVDVSAAYEGLKGSARFIASDGTQANHATGGDKPYVVRNSQGEGVEFKKWGFIVNVLTTLDPNDPGQATVQLQVELSGPVKGVELASNEVPAISTWQFQTTFKAALGRKVVVFDSPARVEVTVDLAKGP